MRRPLSRLALLCLFFLVIPLCGCDSIKKEGTWDATPKVLTPEASGAAVSGNEVLTIDSSNTGEGYIMVAYTGGAERIKFFVTGPDGNQYTYDIGPSGDYTTIPLSAGSGSYYLDARENVGGDMYAYLYDESIEVGLTDEFRPFLYPNQFAWFTGDYQCVALAAQEAGSADDTIGVVTNIYNYVTTHVSYDTNKAESVVSGAITTYLPNPDETLASGTGICFDYAALTAAMLRSQGIPTKLEIGYAGDIYHAWVSVWTAEAGWIERVIEFKGNTWTLVDPTFGASGDNQAVAAYIGDGSSYAVQYTR